MKTNKSRPHNILWGLWFIAAAGIIVLHITGQLGHVSLWSLLVGIPVATWAIISAVKLQWFNLFLQLGILTFIFRGHIEGFIGVRINLWALLGIVILLSIGFHAIFGKGKWDANFLNFDAMHDDYCDEESVDGEKLYFASKFGGASKYVHSENLSYVSVKNSFSGMEIYFENATLSPDGAVVNIDNSFGGVELYIPRTWNVVDQISNFAGGVDCPSKTVIEGSPTIILRGRNSFGGVEVELV